jgi:hypothetical protein
MENIWRRARPGEASLPTLSKRAELRGKISAVPGPEPFLRVTPGGLLRAGKAKIKAQFISQIGHRLGRPGYQPPDLRDAIAHWMKYDSWQSPSRPHTTFPQTRGYRSACPAMTRPQTLQRHERSAMWFELYRRGGRIILHHEHIRPVPIRE